MTTPENLSDQAHTRAEPLPEERAAETGGEDRESEAAAILGESEERLAEAVDGIAPGDAADEHRTTPETAR